MVYEDGFEKGYTPREAENSPYLAFYININSLFCGEYRLLNAEKMAGLGMKEHREAAALHHTRT